MQSSNLFLDEIRYIPSQVSKPTSSPQRLGLNIPFIITGVTFAGSDRRTNRMLLQDYLALTVYHLSIDGRIISSNEISRFGSHTRDLPTPPAGALEIRCLHKFWRIV